MKRHPITNYLNKNIPNDWKVFPVDMAYPPNEQPFNGIWVRNDGLQLVASVEEYILRVSIVPVISLNPNLSDEEWRDMILSQAAEILNLFFPNRKFAKLPPCLTNHRLQPFFSPFFDPRFN